MRPDDSKFATVPVGKLGIIVHPSCAELEKENRPVYCKLA